MQHESGRQASVARAQPKHMTVVTVDLPITVRIPRADPGKGILGLPSTELGRGLLGHSQPVYFIEVVALGLESQIQRHFDDFEKLHADISLLIRGLPSEVRLRLNYALPPLPTASWFADQSKVLEDRRVKLEAMLQKLLLHPEVVYDSAERLWRFLGLHAAVISAVSLTAASACGPWLQKLWEASAEGEGLVPLRHPSVEDSLLTLIASTVGEDWALEDGVQHGSLVLACELLRRTYATGGDGVLARPELVLRRRLDVLVSALLCSCPLPPEGLAEGKGMPSSSTARQAAGGALLAAAKASRTVWQQTVSCYLSASALRHLIAVVETDAEEACSPSPARLVAELLLRCFDGTVLQRVNEGGLGIERKQLLNSLFASQDLFVRLAVGLLLARLLCEPDYAEAGKAELGLAALCRDLGSRTDELAGAGLQELLLEEPLWLWLARLVASEHPLVSGFALLVVVNVVRPEPALIVRTDGMCAALAALVQPEVDSTVRGFAARTLLEVYRADSEQDSAPNPALASSVCRALSLSSEKAVARQADEHGSLCESAEALRTQYGQAAGAQDLCSAAAADATALQEQIQSWRTALVSTGESLEVSQHVNAACMACLSSHRAYRGAAVSNLEEDGQAPPSDSCAEIGHAQQQLREQRCSLEAGTCEMEGLVQRKMELTRRVSECEEEMRRWQQSESHTEGAGIEGAAADLAACRLRLGVDEAWSEDCSLRYKQAVEALKTLRAEVDLVDSRLRELSDTLPALRASSQEGEVDLNRRRALAEKQRHKVQGSLLEWGKVLDVGGTCDAELKNFASRLSDTRTALESERASRSALRGSIQSLVASLVALDGHLESLEDGRSH